MAMQIVSNESMLPHAWSPHIYKELSKTISSIACINALHMSPESMPNK